MLILLSPSKALNFDVDIAGLPTTLPHFLNKSKELIEILKLMQAKDLAKLMKISDKLAALNYKRFQDFTTPFNHKNSKPAIFVFDGDVYEKIDVKNYNNNDLKFAQENLRILSGLYGIVAPLDLIQPYRLEMGTILKNKKGANLYKFWQAEIANYLNKELQNKTEKTLLNLASKEYFDAVDTSKINARIIDIIFKEKSGENYKIVGIFAKKARGLMANFIIKNKIQNVEEIKKFNVSGYKFMSQFSSENSWHFYR